jgi:hypothetical protein
MTRRPERTETVRRGLPLLNRQARDALATAVPISATGAATVQEIVENINKATEVFKRVLELFGPSWNANLVPRFLNNPEDLDASIVQVDRVVQTLISRESRPRDAGFFGTLGHVIQRICHYISPFLKDFLAVGVTGASVMIHVKIELIL